MYFCTLAGVIHYYWLVKSDVREPLMYFGILLVLMLFRVRMWLQRVRRASRSRRGLAFRLLSLAVIRSAAPTLP